MATRTKKRPEGVKANGQLKPGYKYKKGGGVVKAKCKTTCAPKKKKATSRRKK